MIGKVVRRLYHLWIDMSRNNHFKNELKNLEKHAFNSCKRLPKEYKKQIKSYYSSLGYKKIDLRWHKYIFSQTGKMDVRFIPENLYHIKIEPHFTKTRTEWEDKAYMNRFLPFVQYPEVVVRNVNGYYIDNDDKIISIEEAESLVSQSGNLIIKPTIESGSGRGVRLIRTGEFSKKILSEYNKNFIIQKQLLQDKTYAQFNKSSVNTEKIISFLHNGEVFILTSMLRVGAAGAITDTASTGEGYTVGIKDDGSLNKEGYSIYGKKLSATSDGVLFSTIKLEKHREIIKIIKNAHKKLLYFGIISWDFSVDNKGNIILIEYNLNYPDVLIYQMNNGPLFGNMTEIILKECK